MSTEDQKKEASKQIAEHIKAAHAEIRKAEKIADEHGLEFDFSLGYGMGGTYVSEKVAEEWESSNTGWVSSSSTC